MGIAPVAVWPLTPRAISMGPPRAEALTALAPFTNFRHPPKEAPLGRKPSSTVLVRQGAVTDTSHSQASPWHRALPPLSTAQQNAAEAALKTHSEGAPTVRVRCTSCRTQSRKKGSLAAGRKPFFIVLPPPLPRMALVHGVLLL